MAILPCECAVLLDTQVFDAVRLDFNNRNLQYLVDLALSGQVRVLVTSIIVAEIKAHIESEAYDIATKLRAAANHPFVRPYDTALNEKLLDPELAAKIAVGTTGRLDNFLARSGAEILQIDKVPVGAVFEDYFASAPPFGPGRKKSEFPDAVSMHAVRTWSKSDQKVPVYVVSNDADLESFCNANPPLRWMSELTAFLSLFPDRTISKAVTEWMAGQWKTVQKLLTEPFVALDFDVATTHGLVHELDLESMEVHDSAVVGISNGIARIAVDVCVYFHAWITASPPNWNRRHEDDYPPEYEGGVDDSIALTLEVDVTLDSSGTPLSISRVEITGKPLFPEVQVPDDWDGRY